MGLGTAFTVLAVLEATDRMSATLEKVDGVLDSFSETATKAAESATAAGEKIDESFLQTASGADALELASARTAEAQAKLTAATLAQADAEKALLDLRASIASDDELAAAADALAAAQERATASTSELATAQEALKSATAAGSSEDELAVATAAVTAAQQRATVATTALTEAQERQNALVTTEDAAKAADALTAAEKTTAKATDQASAAQERQESVTRAQAAASEEAAAGADGAAASQERLAAANTSSAESSGVASKAFGIAGLAVAAIGYESVKAAGDFQSMTEHLVTDAGESASNLGMIRSGMLALAASTGTTTDQMAAGMYHIESAGYHGQAALDVLKTAAEGAKVGGADLDTIGQALTGTMNAFGKSAGTSTQVMNAMIATVGAGDMKMQDLGSSLGNVSAVAASAGLSYAQVGGAIATMTAQNMTAQRATQDLAHTISSLQNPTSVQIKEMQSLGLNSNTVSKNLGKVGLTGTIQQLTQAIAAHTQGGNVLISTYNNAAQASANANIMIKAMDPSMAALATSVLNGTISYNDYNTAIKALSPTQKALMAQFEGVANKTKSFNSLLTSGSPAAQTFNAAMSKMVGGTTGLNTVLTIGGAHLGTYEANVKTIAAAQAKAGDSVDNWKAIQSTMNQKLDVAKASIEAAGIMIGQKLLPVISTLVGWVGTLLGGLVSWIDHNQKLAGLIGAIVLGLVAAEGAIKGVALATKLWAAAQGALNGIMAIFDAEEAATGIPELILLIGALVAGVVYAYTHFKVFRDVVGDVFSFLKTVVMTYIHLLIDEFKLLWTGAKLYFDAMIDVWDGVADAAKTVWGAVVSAWDAVASTTSAVWGDIVHFFTKIGQDILSALTEAWDAVTRVTTTVWNAITGFFKKWWPALFVVFAAPIALLVALWNHFGSDILSAAQTAWGAIAGFFTATWNAISSAAQSAWNAVASFFVGLWKDISSGVKSAWDAITAVLGGIWRGIENVASAVWAGIEFAIIAPIEAVWALLQTVTRDIESFLSSAWRSIESAASSTWQAIESAIVGPLESAWHTVTSVIGNIAAAIWNGLQSAWNAVEDVGSWFEGIGEDIVNGIIRGIENAGSALFSSLGNLASDALNAAKSFLGIGSPSKVFRDGVGQWIPSGIAAGIDKYSAVAQSAVKRLSTSLTGTAHTAVTGSITTAGSGLTAMGSGGSGNGSVYVNVDLRGATAMSDADFNKLASKVGNAVVKSLPAGGLHVKMGVGR